MRRTQLFLPLVALLFVLAACGAAVDEKTMTVAGGSYTNISPARLKTMMASKDFAFVNVHIPFEGDIVPTDASIPFDQIERRLGELPKDKAAKIVLYCRSGSMSTTAATTLVRLGYTNVYNLDGGMIAWGRAGLPIKR